MINIEDARADVTAAEIRVAVFGSDPQCGTEEERSLGIIAEQELEAARANLAQAELDSNDEALEAREAKAQETEEALRKAKSAMKIAVAKVAYSTFNPVKSLSVGDLVDLVVLVGRHYAASGRVLMDLATSEAVKNFLTAHKGHIEEVTEHLLAIGRVWKEVLADKAGFDSIEAAAKKAAASEGLSAALKDGEEWFSKVDGHFAEHKATVAKALGIELEDPE